MRQIETKIVADSISPQGHRITSMLLTYPRIIHSELMTHRVFSRNSASSRAIPFNKMVKMVEEDPFIPIAWQKAHKGMQGSEYFNSHYSQTNDYNQDIHYGFWMDARDEAIRMATCLHDEGLTKQLCNRLLEPFMWHTVLVTATEWENFFALRCPSYLYDYEDEPIYFKSKKEWVNYYNESQGYKENHKEFTKIENLDNLEWLQFNQSQAEIHIQAIAELMYDAYNESTPKELKEGEYHIPFGDKISDGELRDYFYNVENNPDPSFTAYQGAKLKISTARCARLSYMTFDGEIDYEKDIQLHDRLLESRHASPMEHCAQCQGNNAWYANFKGWQSYRNKLGI